MPIFEYRCIECDSKYEVLHKSSQSGEEVTCPNCNSKENKKLLSTFSPSVSSGPRYGSNEVPACANGSCGCNNGGMCGLE